MSTSSLPTYVLITPARNEADNIEGTLRCMESQTVKPLRWVIVSDNSSDGTDDIVRRYTVKNPWIGFIRREHQEDRQFASKVHAFRKGFEQVDALPYDIVGNLDADVTFDADHMEFLLQQFRHDPELGVAGTPFVEQGNVVYDYRYTNIEHVSGACQLFRRACFEQIGGFRPIRIGGEDWTAVTTARMHGWRTRTFTERSMVHHRRIGSEGTGTLRARYLRGQHDYLFGSHPFWQVSRALYQAKSSPYLIGGLLMLLGYGYAALRHLPRPIPPELVAFIRKEQKRRLRAIFHCVSS